MTAGKDRQLGDESVDLDAERDELPTPGKVTLAERLRRPPPRPGAPAADPRPRPSGRAPVASVSLDDWGAPPEEIAARRAAGGHVADRALERPQSESIDEYRDTLAVEGHPDQPHERVIYGEVEPQVIDARDLEAGPRSGAMAPGAADALRAEAGRRVGAGPAAKRAAMPRGAGLAHQADRALERPLAESIDEYRDTLSLDPVQDEGYDRVVYGDAGPQIIDLGGDPVAAQRPSATVAAAPQSRRRRRRQRPEAVAASAGAPGRDDARPRTAGKGHRLDAVPDEIRLATELGTSVGPVPVHFLNRNPGPVTFAGFHEEVQADALGPRSDSDFHIHGASSGPPIDAGGAMALGVSFQPRATLPDDAQRPTSRTTLLRLLDDQSRSIARVKLRGMARPTSAATQDWQATSEVEAAARSGAPSRPETYDEMRRYLHAAQGLLAQGERSGALALVDAVRTQLDEVAPGGRVQTVFRKYGLGVTTAVLTTGFAKTHVGLFARQLRVGGSIDAALARQHVTTFELAAEPLRELLGETRESPTLRAMHEASPAADAVETVIDIATDASFAAGFGLGVLEGAADAVLDVFKGVVDIAKLALGIVRSLVENRLLETCIRSGKKLGDFFDKAPEALRALGNSIAARWNAADSFERGNFRGEVVGYVVAQVVLIVLTGGTVAAALASGSKWGAILAALRAANAAGDILTYAGAALKLAWKLPKAVVRSLGKAGDAAADVADDAGDAARRVDAPDAAPAPDAARGAEPALPPSSKLASWKDLDPAPTLDGVALADIKVTRAIARLLPDAETGHRILARLAAGDVTALHDLGVKKLPDGFDPTLQEWGLGETADGVAVFSGQKDRVMFPTNVRVLGHTHPRATLGDDGALSVHSMRLGKDDAVLDLDAIDDRLSSLTAAKMATDAGLLPSLEDLVIAAGEGAEHVLHTQFVHLGGHRIGNPLPNDSRPRVSIAFRGGAVVKENVRQNQKWYRAELEFRTGDQVIAVRPMYIDWQAVGPIKKRTPALHEPRELAAAVDGGPVSFQPDAPAQPRDSVEANPGDE